MSNHPVDKNNEESKTPVQWTPEEVVQRITSALADAGHPNPDGWISHLLEVQASYSEPSTVEEQIFLVNRCWRQIIGLQVNDSSNVRYSLIDPPGVTPDDWWESFSKGVIPCVVANNLPHTIN